VLLHRCYQPPEHEPFLTGVRASRFILSGEKRKSECAKDLGIGDSLASGAKERVEELLGLAAPPTAPEQHNPSPKTPRLDEGEPQFFHGAPAPADRESPQRAGDDINLRGPNWKNDSKGWVRGYNRGVSLPGG
jgi:hypothetical protein